MSEILCYKCLTEIEWDNNVPYCPNKDCDVQDGVYQDKTNFLKFGKNKFVVNMESNDEWYKKCESRAEREQILREEMMKSCTMWQNKYYNTFDFKVIEKIKSLISSIKGFLNKKHLIKKVD